MAERKIQVVYVTSSAYKRKENEIFTQQCKLKDGTTVADVFEFDIRAMPIKEVLEVDIRTMVTEEVTKAYSGLKVPCIVEHAGLIFDGYESYPGGLTKPMWDVLKDRFVKETQAANRRARAHAVVAYCDGKSVNTFVGETTGIIAESARGTREFYWDTVFVPDDATGKATGKTYAEIVDDPAFGLAFKVVNLSQSTRAMLQFLEYRRIHPPSLWPRSI